MAITQDELESFHEFVNKKINNGGAGLTLEDCLRQWRNDRDRVETIAGVQRGIADIEAGRYSSLEAADQELRKGFGFSQR